MSSGQLWAVRTTYRFDHKPVVSLLDQPLHVLWLRATAATTYTAVRNACLQLGKTTGDGWGEDLPANHNNNYLYLSPLI